MVFLNFRNSSFSWQRSLPVCIFLNCVVWKPNFCKFDTRWICFYTVVCVCVYIEITDFHLNATVHQNNYELFCELYYNNQNPRHYLIAKHFNTILKIILTWGPALHKHKQSIASTARLSLKLLYAIPGEKMGCTGLHTWILLMGSIWWTRKAKLLQNALSQPVSPDCFKSSLCCWATLKKAASQYSHCKWMEWSGPHNVST